MIHLIFLILVAVLAVAGVVATMVVTARDGYRRIPSRPH